MEATTFDNETIRDEFDRFSRRIQSAKEWVGGDTQVAANTLVALADEMVSFARSIGAARESAATREPRKEA